MIKLYTTQYSLHLDPLMQALPALFITRPLGQTHCGKLHKTGGLGLLQVAFIPKQSAVKICPLTGHDTRKKIT